MKPAKKPDKPGQPDRILPKHGGYRKLRSFQIAELIYDGTVCFCNRFIDRRSRTHDQMVQAARSGRQNIAEGSVASRTSKKMELKLTNVANASLEELLLDYEDYLRQNKLVQWDKNSPEALRVRGKYKSDVSAASDASDVYDFTTAAAEVMANTLICLIHQATYLLKRQIQRLEEDFLEQGGITERLYRERVKVREAAGASETPQPPHCPRCGKVMVRRVAGRGPHKGQPFWGCSGYPDCAGSLPADQGGPANNPDESNFQHEGGEA